MAAEDFAKMSNRKIEIVSADHQNKPDVGAGIARRWFDVEGVDMIVDLPNSAVALAVSDIGREKNKVVIGSGAGGASKSLGNSVSRRDFRRWSSAMLVAMRRLQAPKLPSGRKSVRER